MPIRYRITRVVTQPDLSIRVNYLLSWAEGEREPWSEARERTFGPGTPRENIVAAIQRDAQDSAQMAATLAKIEPEVDQTYEYQTGNWKPVGKAGR